MHVCWFPPEHMQRRCTSIQKSGMSACCDAGTNEWNNIQWSCNSKVKTLTLPNAGGRRWAEVPRKQLWMSILTCTHSMVESVCAIMQSIAIRNHKRIKHKDDNRRRRINQSKYKSRVNTNKCMCADFRQNICNDDVPRIQKSGMSACCDAGTNEWNNIQWSCNSKVKTLTLPIPIYL